MLVMSALLVQAQQPPLTARLATFALQATSVWLDPQERLLVCSDLTEDLLAQQLILTVPLAQEVSSVTLEA